MTVVGVKVELPLHAPVLLLRELPAGRYLPIWIGAAEASAIVVGLDGEQTGRPMTHDLILGLLDTVGESVRAVEVVDVDTDEGVFTAEIELSDGSRVDARPSDAIAVAVRCGAPVRCADHVLDTAGVDVGGTATGEADEEIQRFRRFLENVTADDFGV